MKIAITGHTDGIGKWIYDNNNVVGFSRSNGYDICSANDRKRIVDAVSDCDVFINNACDNYGQAYMLRDLYMSWKESGKYIITVGSRIVNDDFVLPEDHLHLFDYRLQKLAAKDMHNLLTSYGANINLHYVSFAYVGTPKILKKYPHFEVGKNCISMEEAAEIIFKPIKLHHLI
jgi:hypothetical protein